MLGAHLAARAAFLASSSARLAFFSSCRGARPISGVARVGGPRSTTGRDGLGGPCSGPPWTLLWPSPLPASSGPGLRAGTYGLDRIRGGQLRGPSRRRGNRARAGGALTSRPSASSCPAADLQSSVESPIRRGGIHEGSNLLCTTTRTKHRSAMAPNFPVIQVHVSWILCGIHQATSATICLDHGPSSLSTLVGKTLLQLLYQNHQCCLEGSCLCMPSKLDAS